MYMYICHCRNICISIKTSCSLGVYSATSYLSDNPPCIIYMYMWQMLFVYQFCERLQVGTNSTGLRIAKVARYINKIFRNCAFLN